MLSAFATGTYGGWLVFFDVLLLTAAVSKLAEGDAFPAKLKTQGLP